MCSVYKKLITQLIEEGDLWEQLGITNDGKNFDLVNYSMRLVKDIDDLDEKFNKVIDEDIQVFNDTNYFSAFKDLDKRWAVGGYGIVDASTLGKSKRSKKKRYKPTIFHSGHILAQRLFRGVVKGICLNYYNVNNIYPQTELSNRGSVYWGKKFFDNGDETLTLNSLKKLKIDSFKLDMWKKKSKKISQVISTKNLMDLTKKTKVIFIKPIEANKKIDWKEIYDYTILNFKRFIKILFSVPRNLMILWLFFILMQFSFWDTFVSTFFVQYIKDVTDADSWNQIIANTQFISWYAWLWIIAIPWFLLQDPFINLSKKFWEFNILMLWAFLSGASLVLFWFYSKDFTMILILWLINSVWYAAVIWVWQWLFSERYNVLYALKNSLKQIDSTVSAAPLKIILNLANVIWLILWAFIVQTMWFEAFFIGFGWLLLWLFTFSIVKYKAINDSWKEWDWMFAWTEEVEKHTKEIEEFDGEVFT